MPIDPGYSDYIKRRASAWNKATGGQSGLASALFASQISATPQQEQELVSNPEFREYATQQQAAANKEQPSYVAYGPEFEVAATAPAWLKTQREQEANFPKFKSNLWMKFVNPQKYEREKSEYETRRQGIIKEMVASKILQQKPYLRDMPADQYMAALSPKEREYLAGSSAWDKTSKTYWDKLRSGLVSSYMPSRGESFLDSAVGGLVAGPFRTLARDASRIIPGGQNAYEGIRSSAMPSAYTKTEGASASPFGVVEGVGGLASKPIQGLLNKLGVTDFKTQEGKQYDFTDALKGRQNDAGFIADMATDLTNLVGAGMANRFARLMKAGRTQLANDVIKEAVTSSAKKSFPKIKNLPSDIAESEVRDIVQKNIDWVKSEEYIKRRMANTGESREAVVNSVNKWVNDFNKSGSIKFLESINDPLGASRGLYASRQFGFIPPSVKINLEGYKAGSAFNDVAKEQMLNTIDHEIKHALSPAEKQSKLYKNYPKLDVSPKKESTKETLIRLFGNKDSNRLHLEYLNAPEEQQVRALRLYDLVREKLNINELREIKPEEWERFVRENPNLHNKRGFEDVYDLLESALNKQGSKVGGKEILDWINKAWSLAPAAVAGSTTFANKKNK